MNRTITHLAATGIALAISLVLPSILLPFALQTRRAAVDSESRVVQGLLFAQTHGTFVIGLGLADALAWILPGVDAAHYPRVTERYRHHFLQVDGGIGQVATQDIEVVAVVEEVGGEVSHRSPARWAHVGTGARTL